MKKEERELVAALKKFYSKNFAKLIKIAETMHSTGEISDEAYEELAKEGFKKEAKKAVDTNNYRAKTVLPEPKRPDKLNTDPGSSDYGRMMKWQNDGCGEGYVAFGESKFSEKERKAAKAEYRLARKKERLEAEEATYRNMTRGGCGSSPSPC